MQSFAKKPWHLGGVTNSGWTNIHDANNDFVCSCRDWRDAELVIQQVNAFTGWNGSQIDQEIEPRKKKK